MKLFDYQNDGVNFIRDKKKVYIAFDMGMGKTLTSIAGHEKLHDKNILIIAEKNEIVNSQNFKKEVESYFPGLQYTSLRDTAIELLPNNGMVCGINPDALSKISDEEISEHFGSVIIDEATMAKTVTTARFKKIKKVCSILPYVTLLSGTPMMNGASEIYAPLYLMDHWLAGDGSKKSKEMFETIFAGGFLKRIRYSGIFWKDFQWWAKGANNVRELRWLIKEHFFFKEKKETNVFKNKVRKIQLVQMSEDWVIEYESAWDEYLAKVKTHNRSASKDERKNIENIKDLQNIIENGQMYQVNSKWKAREIVKDIRSGKFEGKRIIVWSIFIETDEIIQNELKKSKIEFETFENLDEWKKGTRQVLVGRIKSHGKGGNVPQACVGIFCDMDYVPTMNLQAENRIDRPEQTRDMEVIYYMVDGENIDEHVQKINKDKMRKIEKFMTPFSKEEAETMPRMVSALKNKYTKEFMYLRAKSGQELSTF